MPKLIIPDHGPYALTLSGGGSKGAYTAGVLQFLAEVRKLRDFRAIYGTSTGALAGAAFSVFAATGDIQYLANLLHIYRTVKQTDVLRIRHSLAQSIGGEVGSLLAAVIAGDVSINDATPLKKLIDRFIPKKAWEILIQAGQRSDPLEVGFCTVNLKTAESIVVTNRSHPDPEVLANALWASAAQPVLMQPVDVFGDKDTHWIDGGLRDYNPIGKLFESEVVDESVSAIISVNLDNPKPQAAKKDLNDVGAIFLRTLEVLVGSVLGSDIRNAQLWNVILKVKEFLPTSQWKEFVKQLPPDVKKFTQSKLNNKNYLPILRVIPQRPITQSSLEFKQPQMKKLVNRGFKEAFALFGAGTPTV